MMGLDFPASEGAVFRRALVEERSDVAGLFARFPRIRLATRDDQPSLTALHRSFAMESGAVSLTYDFAGAPLEAAGESGTPTFVALFEEEGQLRGTASLACRRARVGDETIPYAYLANLRVAPGMSAGLRREWRAFYGALVRQARSLPSAGEPRFLLTAVLDENQAAMRALTRRLKEVRYLPLQRYVSVTALAPTPLARRRTCGVELRFAGPTDLPRIRAFLSEAAFRRGLGEDFSLSGHKDELSRRLRCWRDFSVRDFIVAEADDGRLLAVTAPRLTPSRKLRLERASRPLRAALRGARLLGVPAVQVPGPLELLYLTHLELSPALSVERREAVLEALLAFVWERVSRPRRAHALSFALWPELGWPLRRLRGWLQLRTPGTLYQVVARDEEGDERLRCAAAAAPLPLELCSA